MTETEEIAQLEFSREELCSFSPEQWRNRSQDEYYNYQFLVEILKLDDAGLVQRIEASADFEPFMILAESFARLSDRMSAFRDLLQAGHARLVVALARVETVNRPSQRGRSMRPRLTLVCDNRPKKLAL